MKKAVVFLIIVISLMLLISTTSGANTRILSQKAGYCESGETISEQVRQGERVEVSIKVLISEEKELYLFSELNDAKFYHGDEKISDNSSINLVLPPGSHILRCIGMTPSFVADGEEITLLGSYSLGKYITARISSPYILKNTAYSYVIVSGILCAIITAMIVFFVTKGKLHRMKSSVDKKSLDHRKKVREEVMDFVKGIAPNLNADQRRGAKKLLRKLDEA